MSASRTQRGLVACLGLLVACHKGAAEKESEAEPVPVVVEKVSRRSIADTIECAGNLEPPPGLDVKLGALVVGRLAEVTVSEGDRVKAGQVLARIEAAPLRDTVLQAEAALRQAKTQEVTAQAKLARTERLVTEGVAARQEAEDARSQEAAASAALRTAKAALSTAQAQLSRATLKAPFDGLVAHVFAAAGEPVDGSGKPIIEVARTDVLELRAGLTAVQAVRVNAGQRAEVRVDGLPDRIFPGTVIAVAPVVDPTTGVAVARIRIDNRDGVLKGGAFARARLVTDVHEHALVIPRRALLPSTEADGGGGATVDVVEGGKAHPRPVRLGYSEGQRVEVRDGLREGEEVIVGGAYALPDGTAVRAQSAPSAAEENSPPGREP